MQPLYLFAYLEQNLHSILVLFVDRLQDLKHLASNSSRVSLSAAGSWRTKQPALTIEIDCLIPLIFLLKGSSPRGIN